MKYLKLLSVGASALTLSLAPLVADITPAEAAARVATDDATVKFLELLCDDHGGRLTGAPANEAAMVDLEEALRELGLEPVRETFPMQGWVRKDDTLTCLLYTSPSPRD